MSKSDDTQYSPKVWVAKVAVDAIFKGKISANIDYSLADKYLSYINPLELDGNEKIISGEGGRERRVASPKEQWYTRKTKALVELKQYDECLDYIEQAFRNISNFHNNAEHWLNYKKAQCYFAQEKYEDVEKLINNILNKFQHWCFYEMLFNVCLIRKGTNEALKYGAFCATADREHKTRVNFYVRYAEFLDEIGKLYEAALHFKLAELIRAEEGWKQLQLPNNYQYPSDVLQMNKKSIIYHLNDFWRKEKEKDVEFRDGIVDRILPNGKSGFVRDNDGNSYYFNVRDFDKRDFRNVEEGIRVRFSLTKRLDKKKNEMKYNAITLSIVR